MKNRRSIGRTVTAVLGLALLAAGAGGAAAQGLAQEPRRARAPRPGGMRGMGEWWNNPHTVERLGLDEGTREQIDQEVYEAQQGMIDLNATVQRERLDLEHLLKSEDDLNLREVESQVDRLVKAQGAVMKNEIMLRARVMTYLTPDQRAELSQLHQQRRQRRPPRPVAPGERPDAPGDDSDQP